MKQLMRRGVVKKHELELSFDVVRQVTAQALERYRAGGRDAVGFGVNTLVLLAVACDLEPPARLLVEAGRTEIARVA